MEVDCSGPEEEEEQEEGEGDKEIRQNIHLRSGDL